MTMTITEEADYRKISAFLKSKITTSTKLGIICGSGLSGLSKTMTNTISFSYSEIPGFPQPSVAGHAGELVFGDLSGVPAVCLRGRFHSYEGYDMKTVVLPVRVLRCLGVKFLVVTNAAGGLNRGYNVGDVVCVMDHFALPMLVGTTGNPLMGPNDDELGPLFPPSSNIYDEELQSIVMQSAKDLDFSKFVRSNGTYCFVSGPQYESRAEGRFLLGVGGDCVGMSTIPEVLAAHHCGMKVLCLSLITNKVCVDGSEGPAASHQEVLDAVNTRSVQIQGLVKEIVKNSRGLIESLPELKPITLPTAIESSKSSRSAVCSTCGCLPQSSYPIGSLTVMALSAPATVLLFFACFVYFYYSSIHDSFDFSENELELFYAPFRKTLVAGVNQTMNETCM